MNIILNVFDIQVPENKDTLTFEAKVKKLLAKQKDKDGKNINITRVDCIKARNKQYLRFVFKTKAERTTALDIITKNNSMNVFLLETASDDEFNYFRKAAREYRIPLSGWALLKNYNIGKRPYNYYSPLCKHKHAFYVSVENFQSLEDSSLLYKKYPSSAFIKDRTLVFAWDIETYSSRGPGPLPIAKHESDSIFMICITVHWKDDPTPLKKICLVDVATTSDSDWITIVCGNETNLLKAFALCWQSLAPDVELTFNGSTTGYSTKYFRLDVL